MRHYFARQRPQPRSGIWGSFGIIFRRTNGCAAIQVQLLFPNRRKLEHQDTVLSYDTHLDIFIRSKSLPEALLEFVQLAIFQQKYVLTPSSTGSPRVLVLYYIVVTHRPDKGPVIPNSIEV
ncbi:hypothetical protein HRR85_009621 [Exophiala dermatitidis]|nr:hypothetical protein HRR85_009621 [Exophiala dermatitidis]